VSVPHLKRVFLQFKMQILFIFDTHLKIKDMYWLIERNSKLSLENKILLYKTIIKPIWTYEAEIWGCVSKSNISIIQRSQSKILRMIANAPWYVHNINTS
jgi:hypothetical protein